MKYLYQLCCYVITWKIIFAIQPAKIQIFRPRGIKFIITDDGYKLVGLHYSINIPVYGIEPGEYNYDITDKEGDYWVHLNAAVPVDPDDTVYYWLYVIYNGSRVSKQLLNQSFRIPGVKKERDNVTFTTAKTIAQSNVNFKGIDAKGLLDQVPDIEDLSTTVTTTLNASPQSLDNGTDWSKFFLIALGVLMIVLAFGIGFMLYRSRGRCRNKKSNNETKETTISCTTGKASVNYLTNTSVLQENKVYHHLGDTNVTAQKEVFPDSFTYDLPVERRASGQYDELQFPNNTYLELEG